MTKKWNCFKEQNEIRRLHRQWEVATDEDRPLIEQRIAEIRRRGTEEPKPTPEPEAEDIVVPPVVTSKQPEVVEGKPEEPILRAFPPLDELPHAPYCMSTEFTPMVNVGGKWMDYATYREKNPDENIFDLTPNSVAVMYLNHRLYQELLESSEDQILDRRDVMSCVRRLPNAVGAVEVVILEGLLLAEAMEDLRIQTLGYHGETMDEYKKNGLYDDFFDGIIYNVLHSNMTLEEARYFAEHGKLPDSEEQQPVAERQSGNVVNGKPVNKGNRGHQQNGRSNGHNQRNQSNGQNRSGSQNNRNDNQNRGGQNKGNQAKNQNVTRVQPNQSFAMMTL